MRLLVPIGKSRANIVYACRLEGVTEVHILWTKSLFPTPDSFDKFIEDIFSTIDLREKKIGLRGWQISGPEDGPVVCRESMLKWREENQDYDPEAIFVTASTNQIITQLCHMFPDSELLTLREDEDGGYFHRLKTGEVSHRTERLDAATYLQIHGIRLLSDESDQKMLEIKGHRIKVDMIKMPEKRARLSIGWKKPNPRARKEIGGFVQSVVDSCGPFSFDFVIGSKGQAKWFNKSNVRIDHSIWEEEE